MHAVGADRRRSTTPKPKRQYDALELTLRPALLEQLVRQRELRLQPALRQLRRASPTPTRSRRRRPTARRRTAQQQAGSIARPGSSANRAWDLDELVWDSHGNLDVLGRLATDRPHVVKLYGSYMLPFGTQVGAFFYAGSGTPISTHGLQREQHPGLRGRPRRHGPHAVPVADRPARVARPARSAATSRLRLELNVLNLFNQKTARHIFDNVNRPRPPLVGDQPAPTRTWRRATTTTR